MAAANEFILIKVEAGRTLDNGYLHESAGVAGKRQTKKRKRPLHIGVGEI